MACLEKEASGHSVVWEEARSLPVPQTHGLSQHLRNKCLGLVSVATHAHSKTKTLILLKCLLYKNKSFRGYMFLVMYVPAHVL